MNKNYKQIVVLSGKGGTGKTTITAAFSELLQHATMIDCDVDAANLYLLLNPRVTDQYPYNGEKKATINSDRCSRCGLCEELCRFGAIHDFEIDLISCEGCGLCYRACPSGAITFKPHQSGTYYKGLVKDKSSFYYAKLLPGEGNSGKLVSEIRKHAIEDIDQNIKWILIDGPPGIGCPVNASISGVDYAVVVTEPTLSGVHDLKRLMKLLTQFQIPFGVIVNKYDLNESITESIASITNENKAHILGNIPYNKKFVESVQQNTTIVEYDEQMKELIETILSKLLQILKN